MVYKPTYNWGAPPCTICLAIFWGYSLKHRPNKIGLFSMESVPPSSIGSWPAWPLTGGCTTGYYQSFGRYKDVGQNGRPMWDHRC